MKKLGRVGKELQKASQQYHKDNPGAQQCFYCLFIGIETYHEKWNAEHTYSKARHPELRLDISKWVKSCDFHNQDKGSLDIDEYLEKLKGK